MITIYYILGVLGTFIWLLSATMAMLFPFLVLIIFFFKFVEEAFKTRREE